MSVPLMPRSIFLETLTTSDPILEIEEDMLRYPPVDTIHNLGQCVVKSEADGQQAAVPFNHMKVNLPILSATEMMTKGSTIQPEDNGGVIANARTGQPIHFMIHDDLWHMELKVKAPGTIQSPMDLMHLKFSPFGRQGSR